MKQILLICAVVALVGCASTPEKKPLITNPIVEKAIRGELNKLEFQSTAWSEGELTKADLAKLSSLYLGDTKITDVGLKEVVKMKKLTDLTLHRTQITDVGLKEVAKLQRLEELYLGGTQITDAGLEEVAKLQQLTTLDLLFTKVTKAGVAELQKALPNCKIYSDPTK